eukprot:6541126-Pyramimonas_sp.AAC.1
MMMMMMMMMKGRGVRCRNKVVGALDTLCKRIQTGGLTTGLLALHSDPLNSGSANAYHSLAVRDHPMIGASSLDLIVLLVRAPAAGAFWGAG